MPYVNFKLFVQKEHTFDLLLMILDEELGCGGVLSGLRRTAIGNYSVDEALSID